MTLYYYKAAGKEGILQKGVLEAASTTELKIRLRELGFSPIRYSKKTSFIFSRKVNSRTLMDLCFHLEQFESAGIPLKESLEELHQAQSTLKMKSILFEVIKDVGGGLLFSQALAKHASVFDPVFIGLVTAGEKTGRLSFVLRQLFDHLQWVDEIQAQVFKAIRYPLIMGGVLFAAVLILMTVLVPELVAFIKNFSQELPASTRLLLGFSGFLSDHIFLFFVIVGMFPALLLAFFQFYPKGHILKDHFLNVLPVIGPLRRKVALTRFCHIFAVMFESGVDILQALQTARKCLKFGQMYHTLENVETFVREGFCISDAFQKAGFFPPLVVRMIKVGEQTSSLQKTLHYVKKYFDLNLKREVDHIIGLIEPLMILCIGIVMAGIIYSVFLPLYDVLSVLDY